ncbi:MAG: hypothetical protein B6U95_00025 [Thermofilum sp. ex4484_82]|nr:MAG: hypothetical protein B6U95_00025 [Thermofilum sp. ex4484_82]OYT40116.1 MAG: hypothetical protein B6U96_00025 [Archaeoglobales archaeon ex4484_92]
METELNEIWKGVLSIKQIVEDVNRKYLELYRDNGDELPLISEFTINMLIRDAKSILIRKVMEQTLEKHGVTNIEVDEADVGRFLDKDFNIQEISQYIMDMYVKNADEIAYKRILSKAKKLRPKWGADLTLNDIVKGKKLVLRVWWHNGIISAEEYAKITALEKLINIVLNNEKPRNAKTMGISEMIYMASHLYDYSQARNYVFDNEYISGIRIYKNGKFEIKFKKEDYARKVAKALLFNSN